LRKKDGKRKALPEEGLKDVYLGQLQSTQATDYNVIPYTQGRFDNVRIKLTP
jgi:hypothetical protein